MASYKPYDDTPDYLESRHDYEYSDNLDLRPKSELHKRILREVNERVQDAKGALDVQAREWKRMDWTLNAYMPADEADARLGVG